MKVKAIPSEPAQISLDFAESLAAPAPEVAQKEPENVSGNNGKASGYVESPGQPHTPESTKPRKPARPPVSCGKKRVQCFRKQAATKGLKRVEFMIQAELWTEFDRQAKMSGLTRAEHLTALIARSCSRGKRIKNTEVAS